MKCMQFTYFKILSKTFIMNKNKNQLLNKNIWHINRCLMISFDY